MRSRYTAHVLGQIDYLMATWDAPDVDRAAVEKWARESTWIGLEIVRATDDVVEFRARYRDARGAEHVHHERSRFRRCDGRWRYVGGKAVR